MTKWKPSPGVDQKKVDPRVIYRPQNVVSSYQDEYGEERIIHAPKGRTLRRFEGSDTPIQRMNRAVAILLGANIRARRQELGMSMRDLCLRAGVISAYPKNYIRGVECPPTTRAPATIRMGTLYGIARALRCEPGDLLPTVEEVSAMAGVEEESVVILCSAQLRNGGVVG